MRFAIIDDLAADTEELYRNIRRWSDEHHIPLVPKPDTYTNGAVFLEQFDKNKYDVIFLDIYMDGITGMDTARRIRSLDNTCRLIFTTSSPDFAVESYEVDSSYYLLKPYTFSQFSMAMERCGAELLEASLSINVPGKNGTQLLFLHQILYTECDKRSICVHLKNHETLVVPMKQSDFAPLLLIYPYFCDCIRGVIINFEAVSKLKEDHFLLTDGTMVPVSRLKYQSVRQKFLDYCYSRARGGIQKTWQKSS